MSNQVTISPYYHALGCEFSRLKTYIRLESTKNTSLRGNINLPDPLAAISFWQGYLQKIINVLPRHFRYLSDQLLCGGDNPSPRQFCQGYVKIEQDIKKIFRLQHWVCRHHFSGEQQQGKELLLRFISQTLAKCMAIFLFFEEALQQPGAARLSWTKNIDCRAEMKALNHWLVKAKRMEVSVPGTSPFTRFKSAISQLALSPTLITPMRRS